ncbi:hypothetical protein ACLB2K_055498 [Fragaria x ananassa]
MSLKSLAPKSKTLHSFFNSLLRPTKPNTPFHPFSSLTHQTPPSPQLPHLVNEISRILSDHRDPHHDLELSLSSWSIQISPNLVEQVLKRCKNLGFSAHRFFLWAKTVPGFQHSDESHHILIDILGSSGQFALLWDFLIEMRESKCCEIGPELFWVIFRVYSRANLPRDAIRAYSRMVEFGIKPSIHDLDHLLYTLCKRKHVKHAQEFFDKVKSGFELGAKTYSILMRGWGDICDSDNARKLFDEMTEKGCLVDVPAYNSYLEALCKGGNVDEAYKIFCEMGSKGVEPDAGTYSIFIRAYCEANDIHSVFSVLDRMKRYNLLANVFTYNCVIKKLCKNERVEEAYQLLDEMIEMGVKPDEWSYNAIQAYHCEHGEVNQALRLLSRMEKDSCMPDHHTYNMVLKLLIRIGRFDRATDVWERMGKRGFYPSVSTYSVMIHGLCKKKHKLEEACKYFEIMIDEGIPPYSSTVEMLRNRLLGLGLLDDIEILARCNYQRLLVCLKQLIEPEESSLDEFSGGVQPDLKKQMIQMPLFILAAGVVLEAALDVSKQQQNDQEHNGSSGGDSMDAINSVTEVYDSECELNSGSSPNKNVSTVPINSWYEETECEPEFTVGIDNEPTQNALKKFVQVHNPEVLCLAEPFVDLTAILGSFWRSLNLIHVCTNDRGESCPNIWVFCKLYLHQSIQVLSRTDQQISLQVTLDSVVTIFTAVYAKTTMSQRRALWLDLADVMNRFVHGPWLVVGDFNAVLGSHEKKGGAPVCARSCEEFQAMSDICQLVHIDTKGAQFTWARRRGVRGNVELRLDRCLANLDWLDALAQFDCFTLLRLSSDHNPLIMSFSKDFGARQSLFRFRKMWVEHTKFKDFVRQCWGSVATYGCPLSMLQHKLRVLRKALWVWNWEVFGNIHKKVDDDLNALAQIQHDIATSGGSDDLLAKESVLQASLTDSLRIREMFWREKSRQQWLAEGDRNTSYFHAM